MGAIDWQPAAPLETDAAIVDNFFSLSGDSPAYNGIVPGGTRDWVLIPKASVPSRNSSRAFPSHKNIRSTPGSQN